MILIGFMGSGKTTIAEYLAEELNLRYIDIDDEIIKRYNTSISEIFAAKGESGFREKEYEVLKDLLKEDAIISTGGGVITYPPSLKLLQEQVKHKVFYLEAPFHILYDRIKGDNTRPLASQGEQKVKVLYDSRLSFYEEASDHIIDTVQTVEKTIEDILNHHKF